MNASEKARIQLQAVWCLPVLLMAFTIASISSQKLIVGFFTAFFQKLVVIIVIAF